MAREGADVIINGRKKNTADQVVNEIKEKFPGTNPQGAAFDISIAEEREKLFKQIPQVDVLVNNMGIFKPMNYFDISEETWQHLLMRERVQLIVSQQNIFCKIF